MTTIVPLAKASGATVSAYVSDLCREAMLARQRKPKPRTAKAKPETGTYSPQFEAWWSLRKWGGSKKEASAEWSKAGIDKHPDLQDRIAKAVIAQIASKATLAAAGSQFVAPFQDGNRWLKNARWEDNIETVATLNDPNRLGYTNADCEKYLSGKEGWAPEKLWAYWVDAFNADRGDSIAAAPFARIHRVDGREAAVKAFVAVVRG